MFQLAARLFRRVALGVTRILRGRPERIETRRELSERFLRELDELVWDGEFSRDVAERIAQDIFEPGLPGQAPLVRNDIWRSYVRDRTGSVGLYAVGGKHDPGSTRHSPH